MRARAKAMARNAAIGGISGKYIGMENGVAD
jgi:hypothetical protein